MARKVYKMFLKDEGKDLILPYFFVLFINFQKYFLIQLLHLSLHLQSHMKNLF